MSKRVSLFMAAFALIFSMAVLPLDTASAAIADGTYQINYEMKEANSANTSIADGYFSKPATLTVENGVKHIQLTVTGSDMIKSLSAPSGPVSVVSESGDTRVVKFKVDGDLSQPVAMDMHIVVPDLYDTTHTARAIFDVSGLASASDDGEEVANEGDNGEGATTSDDSEKEVDNPRTGDNSQIALYVMLLIGSAVAIFAVRKLRPTRN